MFSPDAGARYAPITLPLACPKSFPVPLKSYTAVRVYGQGHVIAYNYVANLHDGLDVETYGNRSTGEYCQREQLNAFDEEVKRDSERKRGKKISLRGDINEAVVGVTRKSIARNHCCLCARPVPTNGIRPGRRCRGGGGTAHNRGHAWTWNWTSPSGP